MRDLVIETIAKAICMSSGYEILSPGRGSRNDYRWQDFLTQANDVYDALVELLKKEFD